MASEGRLPLRTAFCKSERDRDRVLGTFLSNVLVLPWRPSAVAATSDALFIDGRLAFLVVVLSR